MDKIGGQHAVPKPKRADDLAMDMADADIEQIMRRREEARERDRHRPGCLRERRTSLYCTKGAMNYERL